MFSNRTERLFERFSVDVSKVWRTPADRAFVPARIIAPNVNVSTWLKFGLARVHGLATNLDVMYLQRFVHELLERTHPGVASLSGPALQARLLDLLRDDAWTGQPEFAPVQAWLRASASEATRDLRCFELAGEVQRLFEEYAYQRPDLVRDWETRAAFAGTPFEATERWQRALWNRLFPGESEAIRRGEVSAPVSPAGGLRLLAARDVTLDGPLFAFGISYLAPAFLDLLARLAARNDVRLYVLNPCNDFWEDVETPAERRRRLKVTGTDDAALEGDDPFQLDDPTESLPLQLWGRPGREHIRLLHALTDFDFDDAFEPPPGTSLLHRLQRDILERRPAGGIPGSGNTEGPAEPDDSLVLLSCPGIRREAEAVADEVWRFVREDAARAQVEGRPPVRFDEIAVVVAGPEPEAYFAHIAAAFAESHDLPCSITDLPFGSRGGVAEIVQRLLDLPGGRFTRDDVATILLHPLVHARFRDVNPADWERLVERLGVAFGLGPADHRGTYLDPAAAASGGDADDPLPRAALFHWDQALQRLALGLAVGDTEGVPPLSLDGLHVAPAVPDGSGGGEASFLLLTRSLLADAGFARDASMGLAAWADFFVRYLQTYVVASGRTNEADLARCVEAVSRLAELHPEGDPVSFAVARAFAQQALDSLSGSLGRWLAEGVVVSALQPMRAIPFRAVFVMGLDEKRFPRRDVRSRLDLRAARRRAGDVTGREQDAYLFLETLLCARDRLVLSWLGREPSTGDPLDPSSVVADLERTLDATLLGPGGTKKLLRTVPLRRFDPRLFPELARLVEPGKTASESSITTPVTQPGAAIEVRAQLLRDHLDRHLAGRPPVHLRDLEQALASDTFGRLRQLLDLPALGSDTGLVGADGVVELSLRDLERFLRCPLQGHALAMLRLARDEEGEAPIEDEPIDVDRLSGDGALRTALFDVLRDPGGAASIRAHVDALFEKDLLAGRVPVGVLGEMERERRRTLVEGWARALAESLPGHGPLKVTRFGRTLEHEAADERHEPLLLEVPVPGRDPVTVRLSAAPSPRLDGVDVSVSVTTSGVSKKPTLARHLMPHLLGNAFLAAGGRAPKGDAVLCAVGDGGPVVMQQPLSPPDPEKSRRLLVDLCADLLSGPHPYLFPAEVVCAWKFSNSPGYAAEIEKLLPSMERGDSFACAGPVPRPETFPALEDEDAEALWLRRWEPLFDTLDDGRDEGAGASSKQAEPDEQKAKAKRAPKPKKAPDESTEADPAAPKKAAPKRTKTKKGEG